MGKQAVRLRVSGVMLRANAAPCVPSAAAPPPQPPHPHHAPADGVPCTAPAPRPEDVHARRAHPRPARRPRPRLSWLRGSSARLAAPPAPATRTLAAHLVAARAALTEADTPPAVLASLARVQRFPPRGQEGGGRRCTRATPRRRDRTVRVCQRPLISSPPAKASRSLRHTSPSLPRWRHLRCTILHPLLCALAFGVI